MQSEIHEIKYKSISEEQACTPQHPVAHQNKIETLRSANFKTFFAYLVGSRLGESIGDKGQKALKQRGPQ